MGFIFETHFLEWCLTRFWKRALQLSTEVLYHFSSHTVLHDGSLTSSIISCISFIAPLYIILCHALSPILFLNSPLTCYISSFIVLFHVILPCIVLAYLPLVMLYRLLSLYLTTCHTLSSLIDSYHAISSSVILYHSLPCLIILRRLLSCYINDIL